jgi:hypothetical protein
MNHKLNALALAACAMAAGGAHAQLAFPQGTGNSSLVFVAIDNDANIQVLIDLGLNVHDFTTSTAFTDGLTSPVTWNFATNTTSLGTTGNEWSAAYDLFKATQTGENFQWAVFGGDNVTGGSGPTQNRQLFATGNPTLSQMLAANTSSPTSNGLGALGNFYAAVNNFGNLSTAVNGAATTTAANTTAYLFDPAGLGPNFNGQLTWSYLLSNGEVSTFQRQQQFQNPLVFQFGNPTTQDALSPAPITWTFDIATNTLTLAPIPEPGTYAMLLAGLAAVGYMARRRKA